MASTTPHTVAAVDRPPDCCGDGGEPPLVTQPGAVVQELGADPRSNGVIGPKPDVVNQTTAYRAAKASLTASIVNPDGISIAG